MRLIVRNGNQTTTKSRSMPYVPYLLDFQNFEARVAMNAGTRNFGWHIRPCHDVTSLPCSSAVASKIDTEFVSTKIRICICICVRRLMKSQDKNQSERVSCSHLDLDIDCFFIAAQHINFSFPDKRDVGPPRALSKENARNSLGNSGLPGCQMGMLGWFCLANEGCQSC